MNMSKLSTLIEIYNGDTFVGYGYVEETPRFTWAFWATDEGVDLNVYTWKYLY